MRIAVCLSGQPRCIEENNEQLKRNLIEPLEADVFFHFWKDALRDPSGQENQGKVEFDWEKAEDVFSPVRFEFERTPDVALFQAADKCMAAVFETLSVKDFWVQRRGIFNTLSQAFSVHRSNQLKSFYEREQNFIYDYVIRVRSDLVLPRGVKITDLPSKEGQVVVLPDWRSGRDPSICGQAFPVRGSIPDTFAIGFSKDMDQYSDLIPTLFEMVTEKRVPWPGESLFGFNMQRRGLQAIYADLCNYTSFYSPDKAIETSKVESTPYYPTLEETTFINRRMFEDFPDLFKVAYPFIGR